MLTLRGGQVESLCDGVLPVLDESKPYRFLWSDETVELAREVTS
jgi:hypothetical protein